MNRHDVAKVLDEIAVLLEVQGENPFKVRAFQKAARTIESLDVDLASIVDRQELESLPGIGEKIAEKITTLVKTGHLPYFDELKKQIPEGLLELLKIPSLGAKRVRVLYEVLGIHSVAGLVEACNNHSIAHLPGFSEHSEEKILASIKKLKSYSKRHLWWEAIQIVEPILDGFKRLKEVTRVEIAGSVRRKLETVGDLDFVVESTTPQPIMDWFTTQPFVEQVIAKGKTKSSVRLRGGMQAEARVVPPMHFACTLLYFTGSKEHNIKLRHRANEMGYSLSEYGLEPLRKTFKTEEALYKALGLAYIQPELREDRGEVEAAATKALPKLVVETDLRGVFHCHTTYSDGHNSVQEMARAAHSHGWDYIGISDHSKSSVQAHGLNEERLFIELEECRRLNQVRKDQAFILMGVECDVMKDGTLDYADDILRKLDFVIVSIHRSFTLDEKSQTKRLIKAIENPYTTMVGHLTGRLLLRREPYALDVWKVIDACIANGKIIELNANPLRLDMDWRYWHKAKEKGLKCAINPDAHSVEDLEYVRAGINIARKGWLEKTDIINCLPLDKLKLNKQFVIN